MKSQVYFDQGLLLGWFGSAGLGLTVCIDHGIIGRQR
jgi:hypothetical protein